MSPGTKAKTGELLVISNGTVRAGAAAEFGPRVLFFGFEGGENIFNGGSELVIETGLGTWKARGGHRLWAAPEASPRSYAPDNDPPEIGRPDPLTLRLRAPAEPATGLRKEMTLSLASEGTRLEVRHRISNEGLWAVELSAWGITMMRPGGRVILPQEPYRSWNDYLLPARPLVLWHYTDLADRRWKIGGRFIQLTCLEEEAHPQKLGLLNKAGWGAYLHGETLFVKRFPYEEGAVYPDYGCNNEIYTAGGLIELESLGPLRRLEPGESLEHAESWSLYAGIRAGADEDSLSRVFQSLPGAV